MGRKYADCRDLPSDKNCTVAISADSTEELLEASIQHAVSVHGHTDTAEFRSQIVKVFKDGTPPA
jgi:predicted small metal-binding protein